jgi:hypothetical protein
LSRNRLKHTNSLKDLVWILEEISTLHSQNLFKPANQISDVLKMNGLPSLEQSFKIIIRFIKTTYTVLSNNDLKIIKQTLNV